MSHCILKLKARCANQAVLFAVVQPMTSTARTNNPLQLICLDPDQFINALIPTHISIIIFIVNIIKYLAQLLLLMVPV